MKRDIFTADIYFYIKTEFDYAKRDSCLAECRGVVLQRFKFVRFVYGKTKIDIRAEIFISVFAIKMTCLKVLHANNFS